MDTLQDAAAVLMQLEREVEEDYDVPFKEGLLDHLRNNRGRMEEINEAGFSLFQNAGLLKEAAEALLMALDEDSDDSGKRALLEDYIQRIENGEYDGKSMYLQEIFLSIQPDPANDDKNRNPRL